MRLVDGIQNMATVESMRLSSLPNRIGFISSIFLMSFSVLANSEKESVQFGLLGGVAAPYSEAALGTADITGGADVDFRLFHRFFIGPAYRYWRNFDSVGGISWVDQHHFGALSLKVDLFAGIRPGVLLGIVNYRQSFEDSVFSSLDQSKFIYSVEPFLDWDLPTSSWFSFGINLACNWVFDHPESRLYPKAQLALRAKF